MILVVTPTGFIGSKLLPLLLGAGEAVRVIARDPERLAPEIRSRVEVVQGGSDEEGVLERALRGVESVFHVVPPNASVPDVASYYLRFTHPVIAAMRRSGVSRVVTISGVGRRSPLKAGIVSAALAKDIALEEAGLDVRALWCPSFMENMLRSVESIRTQGLFFDTRRADLRVPFVATQDIARSAARLLQDRSWRGPGGLAVLGPEDISLQDIAQITTEVLGREVRYQRVPTEAYQSQLLKYGASENFANGMIEMFNAKDQGIDSTEARTTENTTPTTYRDWCIEHLAPACR
jgi:uncharacterized protein YbjT (DUF2867 family)